MKKLSQIWHQHQWLDVLLITIAALIFYMASIDLFFVWDDFTWIDRARTFPFNPMQMFNCDVMYFDPLVHLFFRLLYMLGGKTPWVYHVANILLHCVNAVLVQRLFRETGGSRPAALLSALFFSTTFASADAVLWPSSAVDLLTVLFSLLSLICYTRYVKGANHTALAVSFLFFCGALASKGTPVVLPAILAAILWKRGQFARKWGTLIPYLLLSIIYLLLVRIVAGGSYTGIASGDRTFNIRNFLSGIASLAFPERYLAGVGLPVVIASAAMFFFAVMIIWQRRKTSSATTVLGLSVAIFATAPLLALNDMTFVALGMQDKFLLSSPSHRLYLATVGTAILTGSVIEWVLRQGEQRRLKIGNYFAVGIVLLIMWNRYEVAYRYNLWKITADNIRLEVESFAPYRNDLRPNGLIALAGFSMSRGFLQPMLATWYSATDMTVLPIHKIPEAIPDEPALLSRRDDSYLFIRKNGITLNLTADFRTLLGTALRYHLSGTTGAKEEAYRNYLLRVRMINAILAVK